MKPEFVGELVQQAGSKPLTGLRWKAIRVPIRAPDETPESARGGMPTVILEGNFKKPAWQLLHHSKILSRNPEDGSFQIELVLKGPRTPLQLITVGPRGDVERSNLLVIVRQWNEALRAFVEEREERKKSKAKFWSFAAGANFSQIQYQESGLTAFSQQAVTIKGGLSRKVFGDCCSLGASAYYTLLPVSGGWEGNKIRFLGLNFRFGFQLLGAPSRWTISLLPGWYYTTTISSGPQLFGFKDMAGPQLFPAFRYALANGNTVGFYGKLSPVFSQNGGFSFANREMALGGTYAWGLKSGNRVAVTLDLAWFTLDLAAESIFIKSNSSSLGLSYEF